MGRILAIDYGRKRCGIAVTDPLKIIANGLQTVPTHQLMDFLKDYMSREEVELIVMGMPTQLNGEPSESMRYITPFLNHFSKRRASIRECGVKTVQYSWVVVPSKKKKNKYS